MHSMGKVKWSEKKISEMQKAGRGQGSGSDYRPWIEVADVSSRGRSRRVWSHKTGRVHELLSDVEYKVFLISEWSRSVVDIQEQYPLDRELTQTLAQQLSIKHPCYPTTHVPTVMTVDFLLTIVRGGEQTLLALNCKREEEAEEARSIEKLEIQRSYFEVMEIGHHLVYHSRIPEQKVRSIEWIRSALLKENEVEPRAGYYEDLKRVMTKDLASGQQTTAEGSLASFCKRFDTNQGLEPGAGLRVARMLMQERALQADLNADNLAAAPLSSFLMTARAGRLRSVG